MISPPWIELNYSPFLYLSPTLSFFLSLPFSLSFTLCYHCLYVYPKDSLCVFCLSFMLSRCLFLSLSLSIIHIYICVCVFFLSFFLLCFVSDSLSLSLGLDLPISPCLSQTGHLCLMSISLLHFLSLKVSLWLSLSH